MRAIGDGTLRARLFLSLGCLTLAMGAPSVIAPAASAATWTLVSCSQSDGQSAPTDGWSTVQVAAPGPYSGDTNSCDQTGGAMFATSGSEWPQSRGSGWMWQFNAPQGSTIAGGTLDVMLSSPEGEAFVLTPNYNYDAADVVVNCQFNLLCGSNGTFTGTVPIDHPGGTSLFAAATCLGPGQPGTSTADCTAGDGANGVNAQLAIYSAEIELDSNATPAATAFSGSLLSPDAHGTADLAFTASDTGGPGVYTVTVLIDGNAVYQGTPDTNQGECASVGTDPNGYLEFLYEQPCQQTETVDIPVDTTTLADGHHELKVVVTDAAQNSSTVLDEAITTLNSTTVSSLLNSPPTSTAAPLYSLSLDAATKHLTSGVSRLYSHSALKLSGTLESTSGVAAPGVAVTLWGQPASGGDFSELAHTTTDGTGGWTLTAPPGSSRLLRIVAGANARAATTTSSVSVRETVTPVLSLHITTPGGARIVFTGQLAISPLGTPRPLVIIEVRGQEGWQAVGAPTRVGAHGHFRYTYPSSPLTIGRSFSFRAETPATGLWQTALSSTRKAVVH
jgi:hypothetical protein